MVSIMVLILLAFSKLMDRRSATLVIALERFSTQCGVGCARLVIGSDIATHRRNEHILIGQKHDIDFVYCTHLIH